MSEPSRSDRRSQGGYVSVYFALVASLVLVPLVFMLIDVMTLAFYRTKLRNTADAVAIAAVAETRSLHIPIPTEWVSYFPVNGWLINGLNLRNVDFGFGLEREVKRKLHTLAKWNGDVQGQATSVTVGKAQVYPAGNVFFPFMYVKIPVTAQVELSTPFLPRLLGQKEGFKMQAEGCAVAWYRPDQWARKWWKAEDPESLVKTLDNVFNLTDEPLKYYRLTNCVEEGVDWTTWATLAELVITEHLKLNDEVKGLLDAWKQDEGGVDMKKTRRRVEKGIPTACKPGDPCIEPNDESMADWANDSSTKKKAEEEAKAAAEAAAKRAAAEAAEPGQESDGE